MELDHKNKIILECLMQDCRMPVKRIAKLAHLTHPAVLYRIKKLEKEKFIDKYEALINLNKLVDAHLFFVSIPNEHKKKFEEHFKKEGSIMSIEEIIHKYNYLIFGPMKEDHKKKIENYLNKNRLQFKLHIAQKTNNARFSVFDSINIPIKEIKISDKILKLDKIDKKLIKILFEGGARDSILELSRKMNLSADLVLYRFKKLNKAGYFTNFFAQANTEKFHIKYEILLFKVKKSDFNQCFEIAKKTKKIGYFALSNDKTYFATMIVKNIEDIEKTMDLFQKELDKDLISIELIPIKRWVFSNKLNLDSFKFI